MRIVGKQDRTEIELDPIKAIRRGVLLDAMMSGTHPPTQRGVSRGTHFNRIDAARRVEAARALNAAGALKTRCSHCSRAFTPRVWSMCWWAGRPFA
jgi:hypothetical protein